MKNHCYQHTVDMTMWVSTSDERGVVYSHMGMVYSLVGVVHNLWVWPTFLLCHALVTPSPLHL